MLPLTGVFPYVILSVILNDRLVNWLVSEIEGNHPAYGKEAALRAIFKH